MTAENFAFAALERAFAQPRVPAFEVVGHTIPYQRFADLLVGFATRMRQLGIDRRSTVGLAINDAATAAIATSAIALLGSKWVGVAGASPDVLARTTHVLAAGPGPQLPGVTAIDRSWFEAPAAPKHALQDFPGHERADDIWMIAHSSGTTGKPKFMPMSYGTVWRRIENPELQDGAAPITCNLFPPTSYVGAKINVGNLVLGGTNVARMPFEMLLKKGVNRVMGSPTQLAGAILNAAPPPGRRIRSCKVTGSQVTAQFVAAALRYFEELHVLYGTTEVGTATLARFTDAIPFDGTVGRPFAGAEVEILDPEQLACAPGSEGAVRVKTPWAVPGYLGEPELTAAFFRDGWFYPGDLGILDGTGTLRITGRIGEVINAGGMKLNATDLDEIVQRHPDVEDGYCFIEVDDQGVQTLSVVVALRRGASPTGLPSIIATATEHLGRSKCPARIYVADIVPRNENGKPMRTQAAAAVPRFQRVVPA